MRSESAIYFVRRAMLMGLGLGLDRRHVAHTHVPVHREAHPRAQHGVLLGNDGVVLDRGRCVGAAGGCMRGYAFVLVTCHVLLMYAHARQTWMMFMSWGPIRNRYYETFKK